ncbi:hypothetical protein QZH41_007281 [Actinostola sp. cb2023]|nr:hypothetical protein QZH41_007281 [Actinostola sp. cb2023]
MTGEVLESFDSIRHIRLLDDTRMQHHNTFIYSDGRIVDRGPMNGPWVYIRDRDCDEEGLCHPSSRTSGINARAFFFDNGGGVWTIMEAKEGASFFNETFFPCDVKRFSTGMLFDREGKAARISFIREDVRPGPSLYWSRDTVFKDGFDLTGEFSGTERILSVSLQQTVKTGCHWNRDYWLREKRLEEEGNTVIYLPDTIMMSFPVNIYSSQAFHISTCCCYTEGEEKEIREQTVFYVNGKFSYFKQGIYYPETERKSGPQVAQ